MNVVRCFEDTLNQPGLLPLQTLWLHNSLSGESVSPLSLNHLVPLKGPVCSMKREKLNMTLIMMFLLVYIN